MEIKLRQLLPGLDVLPEIETNKIVRQILITGLLAILSMTVLQDFIHSRINNYSFYFSESLLFKSIWILFPPIIFLQYRWLKNANFNQLIWQLTSVIFSVVIHVFAVPLMIWGISALFYSHTYSYQKIITYTLAEDLYKIIPIYALSSFVLTRLTSQKMSATGISLPQSTSDVLFDLTTEAESLKNEPERIEKIVVTKGVKRIPLAVDDIFYFQAATPYIEIHLEQIQYLHTETLKSLAEKLNANQFVRIHRSTIINLRKVKSYKSRLNGDYDLTLENGKILRLSRNYSAQFKKFFRVDSPA